MAEVVKTENKSDKDVLEEVQDKFEDLNYTAGVLEVNDEMFDLVLFVRLSGKRFALLNYMGEGTVHVEELLSEEPIDVVEFESSSFGKLVSNLDTSMEATTSDVTEFRFNVDVRNPYLSVMNDETEDINLSLVTLSD